MPILLMCEALQAQEMLGGLQRRVDREVTKGMDTLSQAEAELQVSLLLANCIVDATLLPSFLPSFFPFLSTCCCTILCHTA